MAGVRPVGGARGADWCRERLDFFCAVIHDLDREVIKAELETCETEEDAEGLMQSLLWYQDNNNQTRHMEGATAAAANHQERREDPLRCEVVEVFPEAPKQPLCVSMQCYPSAPHLTREEGGLGLVGDDEQLLYEPEPNQHDHNYPVFLNQYHQVQEEDEEELFAEYEPFPAGARQRQDREESHEPQIIMGEQQGQEAALLRASHTPEPESVSEYVDASEPPPPPPPPPLVGTRRHPYALLVDESSDSEGEDFLDNQIADRESDENSDHDDTTDPTTMESHCDVEEVSDVFFDADEPSEEDCVECEDECLEDDRVENESLEDDRVENQSLEDHQVEDQSFEDDQVEDQSLENDQVEDQSLEDDRVDNHSLEDDQVENQSLEDEQIEYQSLDVEVVEDESLEDDYVMVLPRRVNREPPVCIDLTGDEEGAVGGGGGGGYNSIEDDERLAQELSEELNKEDRERLESDEQMARELMEEMEMEQRRMEEEDEELARRLAEEMEEMERDEDVHRQQEQEMEINPQEELVELETHVEEMLSRADQELMMQMEAEVQLEMRQKEEKAGRVAALINMFPDADPTYLEERMRDVESEVDFRNTVDALLSCQRTEPRMRGYQKQLKQSTHTTHQEEPFDATATTSGLHLLGASACYARGGGASAVFECTICFEEEVPIKDVASCNALYNYHLFCIECIRKHVGALIGQGQSSFRCMNGYCEAEFSWRTLKRVMEPVVYRKVQERRQQEEVMAAGVENLVSCPFCCFMIIMPDPENKVLECLNPECLKESCRMCKEPSHIPLRCEEVEKDSQKDARTILENKMAEAMIRQCPKCGKRFVTEGGCNKMTCTCGTIMCYLCKAVITSYHHFEQRQGEEGASGKCPLWSNPTEVHRGEVREAATQGRAELGNIRLVYDPTADLL